VSTAKQLSGDAIPWSGDAVVVFKSAIDLKKTEKRWRDLQEPLRRIFPKENTALLSPAGRALRAYPH